MADIHVTNNTTMVSFAVSLKTKAQFDALQDKELGQIVFLPNEQCIYFDGYYYGISDSDAKALSDVVSRLGTLENEVGHTSDAMAELTTASNNLATVLLAVKNQVGNTSVGENKTISQALSELQTAVGKLVTGVSSVNTKTGAVVLKGSDIEVSDTDTRKIDAALDNKVTISTSDTTAKTNSQVSGSTLTDTAAIATAIENAHTAAVNANANATAAANASIAKSTSTTAGAISGAKPSDLNNGADIITAIEKLGTAMVGTSSNWGAKEQKTLSQLRDLINTQAGQISALQGIDEATATKITNIIKELKQVSDEEAGDFANTILDKLAALLVSASTYNSEGTAQSGGGYYKVGTTYKNTLQGIIDELDAKIQTAQASGVTQLTAGDGITVDRTTGNVTVSATSAAKTTAALTQTDGHGATTAANSTIQTALSDINAAAAGAHKAADTAQGAAEAAQTKANTADGKADTALGQLKWVVIS